MFVFGIVTGLAAVSVKAQCDGPVLVPGYTAGSCNCDNSSSSCKPSSETIGYRNDYYKCGGCGYDSCSTTSQTVGYVNPGCVDTPNMAELATLEEAYEDCLRVNNGYGYPPCQPPQFCDWNACSMATSGGTPITADVETSLGNANDCCGG